MLRLRQVLAGHILHFLSVCQSLPGKRRSKRGRWAEQILWVGVVSLGSGRGSWQRRAVKWPIIKPLRIKGCGKGGGKKINPSTMANEPGAD